MTEFRLGIRILYIWLFKTAALTLALIILMMIVQSLGGWFTTKELRMMVAGIVIGFTVSTYQLVKRKVSWNERGAEMEREIRELRKKLEDYQ